MSLTLVAQYGPYTIQRGPWTWRRPYQVWAQIGDPLTGPAWQIGEDYLTMEEALAAMPSLVYPHG